MHGIDEETLLAVRKSLAAEGLNTDVIDALISLKVQELNPWLPIDENTPKDREILLFYPANDTYTQRKALGYWDGNYFETNIDSLYGEMPTHYQELPGDPDQGDKNARNTWR